MNELVFILLKCQLISFLLLTATLSTATLSTATLPLPPSQRTPESVQHLRQRPREMRHSMGHEERTQRRRTWSQGVKAFEFSVLRKIYNVITIISDHTYFFKLFFIVTKSSFFKFFFFATPRRRGREHGPLRDFETPPQSHALQQPRRDQ